MKVGKAEEKIRGLKAPQQNRLSSYQGNISTDKDPKVFDGHMYRYLLSVTTDTAWLEKTKNYLDSIGWNQSKYSSSAIREQAERFTEEDHPWFGWNKNYIAAKESLTQEFELFHLYSLQYDGNDNIEDYLPREDTHAGWSYIETGKKEKGEYREGLFQNYSQEVEIAKAEGSFNKPILVGTRTQANNPFNEDGSYKNEYVDKTRLVSMIDIYQIMAEVVFAKRLQTKLSTVPWYAGGKNDTSIHYLVRHWAELFKYWLSIDYSKYDQTISSWLIRDAFDVIRAAYKYDAKFDDELFKIVREDFINKVICLGWDELYESSKGVPSGSMFTQLVDSIVNRLMITTYMNAKGIKEFEMMIMGDDNIVYTKVLVDTTDLSGYLDRNFGIEMHPDKCKAGICGFQDPQFLSREWTFKGVYRLPELLVAKLLYPERFRDYHNNVGMHPSMIVYCYRESFPLGMKFLTGDIGISEYKFKSSIGNGRWLTGLMRYRLLYAS